MKTTMIAVLCAAAFVAGGLSGCSTTSTRIRHNPKAFARLTPEQQSMVQAGHVGLGFSMEAVRLALGDPDRVSTTTSQDGQSTVWHYASYEAAGHLLFTGHYHAARGWWGPAYPYYLDYPDRHVRDRFSVQFQNDRVSGITTETSR